MELLRLIALPEGDKKKTRMVIHSEETGSTMLSLLLTHRSSCRYVMSPRHLPTVRWCQSIRKALKGVRWSENAKCVHTLIPHGDKRHSEITHFHCFSLCGFNSVRVSSVCIPDVAKRLIHGLFLEMFSSGVNSGLSVKVLPSQKAARAGAHKLVVLNRQHFCHTSSRKMCLDTL